HREAVVVDTDALERAVRGAPDLQRPALEGPLVLQSRARVVLVGELPDPLQEADAALHLLVGPVDVLFRRAGEHHEGAGRVGAVLLADLAGTRHVAPNLGTL